MNEQVIEKSYSLDELVGDERPLHLVPKATYPVALCGYRARAPWEEGLPLHMTTQKVCAECLRIHRQGFFDLLERMSGK